MSIDKTAGEIREIIRKHMLENFLYGYEECELSDDSSFLEMGVLDSTGIMELVALIEKEFCIEVKDDEIIPENLDSVNSISRYVYRKLNDSIGVQS